MTSTHLTIGEVAQRSGLAASAVRFYEKAGLVTAERTPGNQRLFRRDVLRRLAFIRIAQKVGLSLEEIVAALGELPVDKAPNAKDWQRLTRGWRERIDQRIELLEALRGGLTTCIGCGCLSLRTCALANPGDEAGRTGSGPQYLMGDER
ncbi:MAG: redox-sensitive transcriptional activator SoxR [Acidimicrobiales bacterium]|jgi:MerR family redox-sensitive transcriptional activator SoxR